MGVGSALMGFFGLVWRILEGVRRVLHLILLLVIFGFILAALHTSIPSVPHTAALVIAPEGEIVEQLASDPVRRAFGQASGGPAPETLLRDMTDAIAAAKSDERIKLIEHDQLDALVGLGGRNGVGHVPEQSLGRRTAGGLVEGAAHRVTRQLLDDFALRGDHQRRGVRDAGNGGMQGGENEAENNQQQNQVQDPANTLENPPDQSKKSHESGPDTHSTPPVRPSTKNPDEVQIFSSMRAALPDKS